MFHSSHYDSVMEGYESLRDYLNRSGVLATGDRAAIAAAKREYRRVYMRRYKRERRNRLREVVLSLDNGEYNRLARFAKRNGYSVPKFLLHLAETHMEGTPIIQHPDRFDTLHLLLAKTHSEVVYMADKIEGEVSDDLERLKGRILELENKLDELSHPKDLESHLSALMETEGKDRGYWVLERVLDKQ